MPVAEALQRAAVESIVTQLGLVGGPADHELVKAWAWMSGRSAFDALPWRTRVLLRPLRQRIVRSFTEAVLAGIGTGIRLGVDADPSAPIIRVDSPLFTTPEQAGVFSGVRAYGCPHADEQIPACLYAECPADARGLGVIKRCPMCPNR